MDSSNVVFLVVGIAVGCVVLGAVWFIIASRQRKDAREIKKDRGAVTSKIGELCASVDNLFSALRLGTADAAALRTSVPQKLEEINSKLKTNMAILDLYFVKYTEKQADAYFQKLLALGEGPAAARAPLASPPATSSEVEVTAAEKESGEAAKDALGESDRLTTAVPVIGSAAAAAELAAGEDERDADDFPPQFSFSTVKEPPAPAADAEKETAYQPPESDDEFEPVTNTYVPMGESGTLEEDSAPASQEYPPAEDFELGEMEEEPKDVEAASMSFGTLEQAPAGLPQAEREDIAFSGETFDSVNEIERTQIYSREALSAASAVPAEDAQELAGESPTLAAADRVEEAFPFGQPEAPSPEPVEAATAGPAQPPQNQSENILEVPLASDAAARAIGESQEQEDTGGDDSLITGEDVMKKMDNFFGFGA